MAPKGWAESRLGEIATVVMGQSPPSTLYNESGDGVPFLQGNAEFGALHPQPRVWITEPIRMADAGDILISVRAPVGELNVAAEPTCIGRGLSALRPSGGDGWFLYYLLQADGRRLQALAQGSTFKAINGTDLRGLDILLPPLPEQKKIAAILSSVDDAIAATRKVIEQTKKVKEGLLQDLLTRGIGHTRFKQTPIGEVPEEWDVVTTGNVCQSIVPGRTKPKRFDGDVPWLTVADLDQRIVNDSSGGVRVARADLREVGGKIVPKGAVLMSCVGRLGVVAIAGREVSLNQQLHAFICGTRVQPAYLYAALSSPSRAREMEALAGQTTIPYLNRARCESIHIPLPSLGEQRVISDVVVEAEDAAGRGGGAVAALEHLKSGLLQDLLTGKVRVTP